jgi:TonB family protein
MKKYLLLSLLSACNVFSQDFDRKIFLDSLNNETSEGKHTFIKTIEGYNTGSEIATTTIYYLNNQLKSEQFYNNLTKKLTGVSKEFYYSGKLKCTTSYIENEFGTYNSFYENGIKKTEGEFIENKEKFQNDLKINNFWDEQNKQLIINGNGSFIENIENEITKGRIKDGLKNGVWTSVNSKTKISYEESYENGKFISGVTTDAENIKHNYNIVEKRPEPKNGMQHFAKFISKKLKIPNLNQDISGRVFLEFIIEKDGSITDIKVIKSLLPELDQAAVDVLNKYKNWIPGQLRGLNVRVRYNIPLKFDIKSR